MDAAHGLLRLGADSEPSAQIKDVNLKDVADLQVGHTADEELVKSETREEQQP